MAVEKKPAEKNNSELARRFKHHPLVFVGTFIVLIIVVVAFVLVPAIVPSAAGSDIDLTFGYYDKIPINYVPGNFFAEYRQMLEYSQRETINSENSAYINYLVWRDAFMGAVVHTAILQEMKKAGYTAPVKLVDRNVAQLPYFQENGRFSPALYRRMDENDRLALWRRTQEETTKGHYESDVIDLLTPSAEGDFIGKMSAVQRSFDMTFFSVNDYPESEYTAYLEEHPELFRSIHLSIITVNSNEREARQILNKIKNGEITFEEAASSSRDRYREQGGDMGRKMIHELRIEIPDDAAREQVIALAKDEYSDIIKIGSSWVFFRVNDAIQEADAFDSAVMEKVRSYVRNYEGGRMQNWAEAQAEDFIALVNEIGFEEALAERSLEKRSFGPVPLNYGSVELFAALSTQSAVELYGAANNENFWKIAFNTPVQSPSKPVVQGSNVLVLWVTEETETEAENIEYLASIYGAYWQRYSGTAIQNYFVNSSKLVNNFEESFFRYVYVQPEAGY